MAAADPLDERTNFGWSKTVSVSVPEPTIQRSSDSLVNVIALPRRPAGARVPAATARYRVHFDVLVYAAAVAVVRIGGHPNAASAAAVRLLITRN